jgi:hypothetical protein
MVDEYHWDQPVPMPMTREESTPRLQIHHQHFDKKHDMFRATSPKHDRGAAAARMAGF